MKALKIVGWVFVPFVMIFVQWKKLKIVGKVFGTIWAVLMGIGIIANMSSDDSISTTTTASSASTPAASSTTATSSSKAPIEKKEKDAEKAAKDAEKAAEKAKKDEYNKLIAQFKEAGANNDQAKYYAENVQKTTTEQDKQDAIAFGMKSAAQDKENNAYVKWRDDQFSAWDGSIPVLKDAAKKNMNDPDSFKHVETTYADLPDHKGFKARMVFRGKNAFGGVVTNSVTAEFSYETKTFTYKFD